MGLNDAPLFSLFWEGSKLNPRTARGFAERLDEDARTGTQVAQLFYPGEPRALRRPSDPLAKLMETRASGRAFSGAPLDDAQLGSLLYAFAQRPGGGRLLPSAGAKYPIEVFVVQPACNILYYNVDTHSVSTVSPAPAWSELEPSLGLAIEGVPSALFLLAAFPDRVIARYGERGGRFLLLECGQYAQNLALRVAHERLAGVEAGGLHDDALIRLLRLDRARAILPLGYAVGPPKP
jgi:hypothetical protein